MKYEIVIGTYNREEKLREVLESIDLNIDTYVYFDGNDKKTFEKFRDKYNCTLFFEHYYIMGVWNHHISKSKADGIFFLIDDAPLLPGSLQKAIDCFEKNFPDTDGLIGFNQANLLQAGKCAVGLVGRKFVDRFPDRNIFCPKYVTKCGDVELYYTALNLDRFVWCEEAKVIHYHPDDTALDSKFAWDKTYQMGIDAGHNDLATWKKRKQHGRYMKRVMGIKRCGNHFVKFLKKQKI